MKDILISLFLKKYGFVIGIAVIKVFFVGFLFLMPIFIVVSVTPSFVGNKENAQQQGKEDEVYAKTINQYQDIALEYLNDKNIVVPLNYVIALDMVIHNNDFSKVKTKEIREHIDMLIKSETRTITYEETVIKERYVTKERPVTTTSTKVVSASVVTVGFEEYCPAGTEKLFFWTQNKDRCRKDLLPSRPDWWIGKYEWTDVLRRPITEFRCSEGVLKGNQCEITTSTTVMEKYEELEKYEVVETRTEERIIWLVKNDAEKDEALIKKYPKLFDKTQTKTISEAESNMNYFKTLVQTVGITVFNDGNYGDQTETDDGGTSGGQGVIVIDGTFVVPMDSRDNPAITASWGLYDPFDTGDLKFHQAIDWASGRSGARIIATAGGTITKVVSNCREGDFNCGNGFGNHIVITHTIDGKQYQSLYGHLQTVAIKLNDKVLQGEILGTQGNTGASGGPHLHFELHSPEFNYRQSTHVPASSAINPLTVIKTY